MVMASIIHKHIHKFEISGNKGYCPCGEIREYTQVDNLKDNSSRVIRTGDPNYEDILAVSKPLENITNKITEKPQIEAKLNEVSGKELEKPARKPKGGRFMIDKHDYIESHKEEILKDIEQIGSSATRKKWGISDGGWFSVRKRWGIGKSKKVVTPTSENQLINLGKFKVETVSVINTKGYLVGYWRKRANNKNTSESEAVIMNLTADALEN